MEQPDLWRVHRASRANLVVLSALLPFLCLSEASATPGSPPPMPPAVPHANAAAESSSPRSYLEILLLELHDSEYEAHVPRAEPTASPGAQPSPPRRLTTKFAPGDSDVPERTWIGRAVEGTKPEPSATRPASAMESVAFMPHTGESPRR